MCCSSHQYTVQQTEECTLSWRAVFSLQWQAVTSRTHKCQDGFWILQIPPPATRTFSINTAKDPTQHLPRVPRRLIKNFWIQVRKIPHSPSKCPFLDTWTDFPKHMKKWIHIFFYKASWVFHSPPIPFPSVCLTLSGYSGHLRSLFTLPAQHGAEF